MKNAQQKPALIIRTFAMCFVVLTLLGCNSGLGKITLNAEINYPGGPRPLGKQTVYLLSNSITSQEMEEAFRKYMATTTPPINPGIPLQEQDIRTRAGFMFSDGRKIWHRYIVDSAETDLTGKVTFRKLKTGDYWIYCISYRGPGKWLLWNVKTTVKFYENTDVTLSNQNILELTDNLATVRKEV